MFEDSSTDMAMAQAVVLYDVYKRGFAPVQAQYEFARAYPDRVLFCGGVDPLYPSLKGALEEMERQVRDLGAKSFKFYNAHLGKSWRCDDPTLAYPMYEKGRELGIKVFQFHKGFPITRARLEDLSPLDIQQAALDFPDLIFAIHHLGLPYFEENFVEPENVHAIMVPSNLDVAIAWTVPLIHHLDDVDPMLAPIKPLGRPSHIGIRLDLNAHDHRPPLLSLTWGTGEPLWRG